MIAVRSIHLVSTGGLEFESPIAAMGHVFPPDGAGRSGIRGFGRYWRKDRARDVRSRRAGAELVHGVVPCNALVTLEPMSAARNQTQLYEARQFYRDKTVLVTGATGFLGTSLIHVLGATDCRILRVSRAGARPSVHAARAEILDIAGDIRAPLFWERCLPGVDYVFHFAAQTSIAVAESDPVADFEANVRPLMEMMVCCRGSRLRPTVLFAGTATQVGLARCARVNEQHSDIPVTTYDRHKLIAEKHLEQLAREGIVEGCALRLTNVYGPGQHGNREDRGVLNRVIRNAMAGSPITVYGTGSAVRDYIYVEDVVRAFMVAGACAKRLNGQHFLVGSGKGTSLRDAFALAARRVALKTGTEVPIRHAPPPKESPAIDMRNFVADCSRFSNATGWLPVHDLCEGIDRTIEAYSCVL